MIRASEDKTASGLPRDLEEAAAKRLVFVSAVAMVVVLICIIASFFRQENIGARAGMERPFWTLPVGFVASLLMLLVARSQKVAVATKLNGGILYLVVVCALTAIFRHSLPYQPEDVMRGVSPLTLAILFFAIVVPMPPRRMAVAATVATLTDPLALGMTFAFGNPVVPTSFWLWLFLPNAIVVGLAVAAARVVYGLGQTVHQVRKMGRYRLVEKLGEGGMGEVWRAEHAKLARPAAVKLIRPNVVGGTNTGGSNDNKAVQRFKREAHATAMLSSPHTVELYDFGVNDDGAFYYVMELLDGMDLETLLDHTKALDPERVVHLLLGLCHSLRDAHQSGVVHRDIKPANIYVCKKGGDVDFVKLLDFGLARRVATDKTESRLTFAGDVIGTPQYIAPESLSGEEVDGRADLYALGCVAYRMLAGRDVFTVSGIMPLLFAHVEKKPTPLGEIRPDIPPELTRIVMRCLAKSPAERPPSSAALMQELQETGLAERWTPKRARAWWNAQRKKQELAVAPTITGSEAIANAETIESS